MEVYLPGDQRLVDKLVYELKAQGIFDQFRKECFSDVDTKPAYQNLRQRVEGSVAGFLKEQSWRPDMNKNQVREMLRKTITESGYLETGVERIVDQVVNPKINTVFLPKVEEVVYNYLGIKKPNKNDGFKNDCDLLPQDLEAVSPESEPVDKKDDKSTDAFQDLDETKTEEDESPPFEPLEEQPEYVPHEENSVDSHLSGFSGLISHESNQSNEIKVMPIEQDSQMSRNSSDSRLSIVTSDENSKMEVCVTPKPNEQLAKPDDKNKPKTEDNKHKSRSDKDKRSSKDSRSRHTSSSKDKEKDKRRDSKSGSRSDKKDKDKKNSSSSSKHSSHSSNSSSSSSKDKNGKDRRDKDKDKDKKHKDSRPRDKSGDSKSKESGDSKTKDFADSKTKDSADSKTKEKSSSSSSHKHSSSHKKDKDKKKSKDDHYSSKDKKNDRRSTDRDSNDGQSSKAPPESGGAQNQKAQESSSQSTDTGNSSYNDNTTKASNIITPVVEDAEIVISPPEAQKLKLFKPKCASNMEEALRLRKIRKQLAKLEKQNQLSFTSVDLNSSILMSASINLDDLNQNCIDGKKTTQEDVNSKLVAELEVVPSPLRNTVISQDNWDAMEAKLRAEVCSEFKEFTDDSLEESTKETEMIDEESCKYFESVDVSKIEFLLFARELIAAAEKRGKGKTLKRKIERVPKNNNNNKKVKRVKKSKEKVNNHAEISEKFSLPLSPAESEKSLGKKEEPVAPLKPKRNIGSKMNSQRYSSDDLYKPRPTFASSRRRGAKLPEK